MKIVTTFLFIFSLCTSIHAQPLSAFINNRNGFSVFDDSTTKQIDFQKPLDFKVGGNCVAYHDDSKSFKVYSNGRMTKVNGGLTSDYQVTSNFVFMINSTTLHVFDGNKDIFLIRNPTTYFVSDSFVGFEDELARKYFLYSKGNIITLIDDIVHNPIQVVATGDNIICYKSVDDSFRIYYHDHTFVLHTIYPDSIRAAKDILAYTDQFESQLHVFYKDHEITPEKFTVVSFTPGNGLVAYETQEREFKIFYKGRTYTIGNFTPQYLQVKDDIVAYADDLGYLNVFYKGKNTFLEKYIPDKIIMSRHTLYYTDASGFLKVFSFGELTNLPLQNYWSVRLDYDVLRLQTGLYDYRFFYRGKFYE